jgi:hypothetical protein
MKIDGGFALFGKLRDTLSVGPSLARKLCERLPDLIARVAYFLELIADAAVRSDEGRDQLCDLPTQIADGLALRDQFLLTGHQRSALGV